MALPIATSQPLADAIAGFVRAMAYAGIVTRDPIVPDGALHRVHIEDQKLGSKNGWYVLFDDGLPAGRFGCWKSGIDQVWSARAEHHMNPAERSAHLGRMRRAAEARDAERRHVQDESAKGAANLLSMAPPAPANHPYLARKRVGAHGIGAHKGRLVVPLRDANDKLWSLQFISGDGGSGSSLAGARRAAFISLVRSLSMAS
jgi:putative DNA primase/helicase